jgi:hypothetical protein
MRKSIFKVAFIALASSIVLTSCMSPAEKVESSAENVEDAQEDLNQAKRDYNEEYNQFKIDSEQKITANEQLIIDLKLYSKDKKAEAKANYEKAISDLEMKNRAMKERIATQKESNNEKWQTFKNEFNHDMDELGNALRDLGKKNVK